MEKNLEEWLQLRQETVYCPLISRISLLIFQFCVISRIFYCFKVCQLRDIATYIELIHKKSSIVKAASSGTGAIGGIILCT